MKNVTKLFFRAILAGICISLVGTTYLAVDPTIGAFIFPIGIFIIGYRGYALYTAQCCRIITDVLNRPYCSVYGPLLLILLGNFIGTNFIAILLRHTEFTNLITNATVLSQTKLQYSLSHVAISSILCMICIYFATSYIKVQDEKIIPIYSIPSIFLPITIFVLCGFEHSVADMFYFALAGIYTLEYIKFIAITISWNLVGGFIMEILNIIAIKNKK